MKNTYRIRRRDRYNWVIERYEPGGRTITKGKYAGQLTKEGWDEVNPLGYYNNVKDAALNLLDKIMGEEWPAEGWTGQDLLTAVSAAEARVLAVVNAVDHHDAPSSSIVNPAADFTPEQVERIQKAGDPVKAYLNITGGKRFKRTADETRRKLKPAEAVLERLASLKTAK